MSVRVVASPRSGTAKTPAVPGSRQAPHVDGNGATSHANVPDPVGRPGDPEETIASFLDEIIRKRRERAIDAPSWGLEL